MKTIIKTAAATAAVITAAALLVLNQAQPAKADISSLLVPSRIVPANSWSTNRVAGSTGFILGTNSSAKIPAQSGKDVAVTLQGNLNGAGTTTFGLAISRTVGGCTNHEIIALITATANGTTPAVIGTNIFVGAFDTLWSEFVTNASGTGTSYLTNMVIYYGNK